MNAHFDLNLLETERDRENLGSDLKCDAGGEDEDEGGRIPVDLSVRAKRGKGGLNL